MKSLYKKIKEISSKYHDIEKVVLFGSRARGDNKRTSDIDIAIFPSSKLFKSETAIWFDIEEIDTLLQFDIVIISKDTNDELIENIKKEGIVLYEKNFE